MKPKLYALIDKKSGKVTAIGTNAEWNNLAIRGNFTIYGIEGNKVLKRTTVASDVFDPRQVKVVPIDKLPTGAMPDALRRGIVILKGSGFFLKDKLNPYWAKKSLSCPVCDTPNPVRPERAYLRCVKCNSPLRIVKVVRRS